MHTSVQTGIPVLYATVLILTDGLRIYCGNTLESKRIASSAPALFILVLVLVDSVSAWVLFRYFCYIR